MSAGEGDMGALLPAVEVVEPWEKADEPTGYQGYDLFDLINGGAELFFQYGFVQVITQEYTHEDDSIICTIYEMEDSEAAYGVYSYGRTPDKPALALGDGGFTGGLQLIFWQDRYYVTVETFVPGDELERALESFATRISERIGDHAAPPKVMERLPRDLLIPRTEKLLEGNLTVDSLLMHKTSNLFQLAQGDVVLYGEYRASVGKVKLFMAVYEDEAKTARLYPLIREAFSPERGYRGVEGQGSESSWVKDGLYTLLRQGEDYIVLVTDAHFIGEAVAIARQK